MRIGMIGAGAIAKVHAETLKKIPGVELGYVFDSESSRAESFAQEWGMKVASRAEAAIEESEAVYINVPNRFHAEYTLMALASKRPVFCEKPFALNLEEAHGIANAVEKAGVIYQLGFNRRMSPAYQKIKHFFSSRSPLSFNIKMNRGELKNPSWTSDIHFTGGFLFESTLHLLDIVRFLLGEINKVTALGSRSVYPCVDNFSLLFEMQSGAHGVFSSCAHASWIYPFERVEIFGEHCSMFNDEMEAVTYCEGLGAPILSEKYSTLPLSVRWGYQQENEIFVQRLQGQPVQHFADHRDGFKNVELMETIYRQIGLGK